MKYNLTQCFSISGQARGGLLISKANADFKEKSFYKAPPTPTGQQIPEFTANNESLWRLLTFWETNIGLSYTFCWCDYEGTLEIGYEFLYYPDFIDRIQFFEIFVPALSKDIYSSLGFQGPYLNVTVGF